eukprot:756616-Hanusia_phi.AAC.2
MDVARQYFVMTTGQTFSEKIGRVVTNPEVPRFCCAVRLTRSPPPSQACLLDWPITDLGRDQWPERSESIAYLVSLHFLDISLKLAHKLVKTTFIGWKLLRNKQKMVPEVVE